MAIKKNLGGIVFDMRRGGLLWMCLTAIRDTQPLDSDLPIMRILNGGDLGAA
jgi:hypothetical protein